MSDVENPLAVIAGTPTLIPDVCKNERLSLGTVLQLVITPHYSKISDISLQVK